MVFLSNKGSSPLLGLPDYWPSRWLMISLLRKALILIRCGFQSHQMWVEISPVYPLSKRRFRSMLGRYLLWGVRTKNRQFWIVGTKLKLGIIFGTGTKTRFWFQGVEPEPRVLAKKMFLKKEYLTRAMKLKWQLTVNSSRG